MAAESDRAGRPTRRRLGRGTLFISCAVACGVIAIVLVVLFETHGVSAQGSASTRPRHLAPLRVVSVSPKPGTQMKSGLQPITITFSSALKRNTTRPVVTGASGYWRRPSRTTLEFFPTERYLPYGPVSISVPAGRDGIVGHDGALLAASYHARFTGEVGTTLRLQQLLAELGYLPLSFQPADAVGTPSTSALLSEAATSRDVAIAPESGTFSWRFAHIPRQLALNWSSARWNIVTEGAVMSFESDHNLATDGEPGFALWRSLLSAVALRQQTSRPYDYVLVSETVPETLYIWRNGSVALQSATNTGVEGAATPLGTWPVYLRFTSTTMSGTNPDGSHYSDPGVPWVSYFHGSDAVHGFIRPLYGEPQSDGCVELPISTASSVFPLDPIGTLVTVTTGDLSSELRAAPPSVTGSYQAPPPAPVTTTTTLPVKAPTREHRPKRSTNPPVSTTSEPTTTAAPTTLASPSGAS